MTPYPAWSAGVIWDRDSFLPLTLHCCDQEYRLTDKATMEADPEGFSACVDHAVEVHHVPAQIVVEFLCGLPFVGMQMRIDELFGEDDEEDDT